MARRGGIGRAAGALATADGVAHLVFFASFGWRAVTRFGPSKIFHVVFAIAALVGFALAFVGGLLVKYGMRTPAAKVGHWAIAGSTALAAMLLVFASWTSG